MNQKISENLHDPEALEKLYRENKTEFTRDFPGTAAGSDSELVRFWNIRLAHEIATGVKFYLPDLLAVLAISLVTAILMKLPAIFPGIDQNLFFTRYAAIIAFNGLIIYTFRDKVSGMRRLALYGAMIVALLLYVFLLPNVENQPLTIVFIHIPLFLWCLFGAAYISFDLKNAGRKMDFIRFNGELLTMTGLLLITGGILTGITIGLFSAIGVNIEKIYFDYIVIPGASVSPILASYLIKLYPDITRRVVPVIARVFTPIVLATLVIYLVSLPFSRTKILEDRNLLILFNIMLVAVTAIIVFSVTELDKTKNRNINVLILLILAIVTLVINAVALTAIITRLTYGITPNRTVVLITNILVFVNLILVAKDLFKAYADAGKLGLLEKTVADYLTVYFLWTIFAIFILPAIFGYHWPG